DVLHAAQCLGDAAVGSGPQLHRGRDDRAHRAGRARRGPGDEGPGVQDDRHRLRRAERAMKPVLLTGGSGVVGSALRQILAREEYIALVRTRAIAGAVCQEGDIRRDRLGLSEADYDELADRIGGIVHMAADTRLSAKKESLYQTNVVGTRNM